MTEKAEKVRDSREQDKWYEAVTCGSKTQHKEGRDGAVTCDRVMERWRVFKAGTAVLQVLEGSLEELLVRRNWSWT